MFGDEDQTLRIWIGQRPQQHGIRHREDCRRRADAEDEHGQRGEGEPGRAPQEAGAELQVAPDRVERGRADVARGFNRLRQSSEIAEGQTTGLFEGDAAPAVRLDLALEVITELLEYLAVNAAASDKSTQ